MKCEYKSHENVKMVEDGKQLDTHTLHSDTDLNSNPDHPHPNSGKVSQLSS